MVRDDLTRCATRLPLRSHAERWEVPASTLMSHIVSLLHEEHRRSGVEVAHAERSYRAMFVLPVEDGFDYFGALLLHSGAEGKLMWCHLGREGSAKESKLRPDEYESVVADFVAAVDSLLLEKAPAG